MGLRPVHIDCRDFTDGSQTHLTVTNRAVTTLTPQPLLPRAGEGEPRFYRDAEYEKKPEPCGATKAGVRRR
jgi:hypothetical protein